MLSLSRHCKASLAAAGQLKTSVGPSSWALLPQQHRCSGGGTVLRSDGSRCSAAGMRLAGCAIMDDRMLQQILRWLRCNSISEDWTDVDCITAAP